MSSVGHSLYGVKFICQQIEPGIFKVWATWIVAIGYYFPRMNMGILIELIFLR